RASWGKEIVIALLLAAASFVFIGALLRSRWTSRATVAPTVLVLAFLILHLVARPVLDPLFEMKTGAKAATKLIPDSEPVLAFHADETTLAIVPFYTGHSLANTETAEEAFRALVRGPATRLIVAENRAARLGPDLEAQLELARTVRLSATRTLKVYEL